MFNFLKKSLKSIVVNEQAVIEKIHNEFDSVGERLLMEAVLISEGNNVVYNKAERRIALGFINSKDISSFSYLKHMKELPELILGYKLRYPFNKFITHDIAIDICKRYGLLLGEISMYKGSIPEKNIIDIENFKIKKEDEIAAFIVDDDGLPLISLQEQDFNTSYTRKCLETKTSFYCSTDSDFRRFHNLAYYPIFAKVNFELCGLKICAPIKEMIIPKGKKIVNHSVVDVPDPIILQPVKGGYLIVSKWGLEASDENIVNEKSN